MFPRTVALAATLVLPLATFAQEKKEKKEALVEQVRTAIDRGVRYLRGMQRDDGGWEINLPSAGMKGGWSALTMLALLNAGVPPEDPAVARGLDYLRKLDTEMTYVRSLQTMVFAEAGLPEDRERIAANVRWLLSARIYRDGKLEGWTYKPGPALQTDNSNSQYALLGLWAGRQAGVPIEASVWEEIRDFYIRTQQAGGGWIYSPRGGPAGHNVPSMTMTSAGICGLLIADRELKRIRLKNKDCVLHEEPEGIARGLAWLGARFDVEVAQRTFYHLYGLERVGRLSGLRFLGGFDWYREGCRYLVRMQNADGAWSLRGAWDNWPVVSTSFSLLFLSKGRTPVLVSKLVHGPWPRRDADHDWNGHPDDLRNLTDFSSKELFRGLPLAWQSFDLMRAMTPRDGGAVSEDTMEEAVSELLQSPILYLNGTEDPRLRLTGLEKKALQLFVESGGFILAEAACGSPAFDRGFKALCAELWPDNDLSFLREDHPVWTSRFAVGPGKPHTLMGISMGCKTVLIYSPQSLSWPWEIDDRTSPLGKTSFELGANIVAYATGMEPPRPRLTRVDVARREQDPARIPRGFLKVAQIKHRGDYKPAPGAMRNLMGWLNRQAGVDVALKTEELQVYDRNLVDFKFLYMHGRRDFSFAEEDLDFLRFDLENGGLLLADACCGSLAFDKAFRRFAKQLFPKRDLQLVPADDVLYSAQLNGEALAEANTKCRIEVGGPLRAMQPYLEGIKIDGRWVLLYSKYDLGCALERHQASDCRGYHPDSAFRIAGAAVLYTLRP